MRKSFCRAAVASILIVLLAFPLPALAWGNTGHEAVACVAWKHLDQATKDKIFLILQQVPPITGTINVKGTPTQITVAGFKAWSANMPKGLTKDETHMYIFMRAATWPDSAKFSGLFHGNDKPPSTAKDPDSNIGFKDRNKYGYWHFIDTPLGDAQTGKTNPPALPKSCQAKKAPVAVKDLPSAPIPNVETQIKALSTELASKEASELKAYDLVWLEHLVGDIHQPLHASVRYVDGIGDAGGNCVSISLPKEVKTSFMRANAKSSLPTELHAFWDDLPGIGGQMDTKFAAAYAATLPAADPKLAANLDFPTWTAESHKTALDDTYASPVGAGFGTPKAYLISLDYYNKAADDARTRISLAGERLAKLLEKDLN